MKNVCLLKVSMDLKILRNINKILFFLNIFFIEIDVEFFV